MSTQHTYAEIAEDFNLWSEFVDPHGNMTKEEFYSLSLEKKIEIQFEAFGKEEEQEAD